MDILFYIIVSIVACGIGVVIGRKSFKHDGMFIVSDIDDQNTKWILDVKTDPRDIPKKKEVLLKVVKMDNVD